MSQVHLAEYRGSTTWGDRKSNQTEKAVVVWTTGSLEDKIYFFYSNPNRSGNLIPGEFITDWNVTFSNEVLAVVDVSFG